MSVLEIILTILSIAGTSCSIIFGYLAFRRNKDKDKKDETTDFVSMRVDLTYIKEGVSDLKRELLSQRNVTEEIDKRLSILESKVNNHIADKNLHNYHYKKG